MAAHPAFRESLRRLRSWGVRGLFGDDVLVLPPPGEGALLAGRFQAGKPCVFDSPARWAAD